MSWLEAALVLAVLIGAAGGVALVARSPSFWAGLGKAAITAALPQIINVVTKRMDPETEARWRACERRGGKWNHRTRKCE